MTSGRVTSIVEGSQWTEPELVLQADDGLPLTIIVEAKPGYDQQRREQIIREIIDTALAVKCECVECIMASADFDAPMRIDEWTTHVDGELATHGLEHVAGKARSSRFSGTGKPMRRTALVPLAALVFLAGCGKSNIVAVKRPVLPIWVCAAPRENPGERCARRFDAGQLIGLRLRAAEQVATVHGYKVRPVAPLRPGGALTEDFLPNRLDVETSAPLSYQAIVVRIVDRG